MTLPGLFSQESLARQSQWLGVPDSRMWAEKPPVPQLQMILSPRVLANPPQIALPDAYHLRQLRADEKQGYFDLMHRAQLGHWDDPYFKAIADTVLPDGWFVIEHRPTGALVGTAAAHHRPTPDLPYAGELGWVAVDPAHRGHRLGNAVCAAVIGRFARAGYHSVYLWTDDHRLAAIKTYLALGFEPRTEQEGTQQRWQIVLDQLRSPAKHPASPPPAGGGIAS